MKGLYLILDWEVCLRPPLEVARAAVRAGVRLVQLRAKRLDTRELVAQAAALHEVLQPAQVPLIINDRLDVALAVGAEGLHVGQSDMPVAIARRLLGSQALLGLSVTNLQEVSEAPEEATYLGLGPIFPTQTKRDASPPVGLEGLRQARALTSRPLFAIGGLGGHNLGEVLATGVDGVCLASAICAASDPEKAARELWP